MEQDPGGPPVKDLFSRVVGLDGARTFGRWAWGSL